MIARVLIIDDEKQNREALRLALGDENPEWQILTADNEETGLDMLRAQIAAAEPVNLILTDLVMKSEQGGMTVIQEARRIDPLVMSILFTAKEKNLDRYKALDYGAFDVVEKNIRGTAAVTEINVKARAALRYQEWSLRINFLRRYFDPRVFETIERDQSVLDLSERLVTICFWDIRGFSLLCEILKKHPTLISGFTQDYCDIAAKSIFAHNGLLDKFIGDGVMALFGVLNHKNDEGKLDALAAIDAALAFRSAFDQLRDNWIEKWSLYTPQKIDISLGCGLHTGDALVGNVGTSFRDQFTALGPNVNFAARLEGRSKNGLIILSQSTEARVRDRHKLTREADIDDIKNIPGIFKTFSL